MSGRRMNTIEDAKSIRGFFGDYGFLSNMYECNVELNGLSYQSSEHAYQSLKASTIEEAAVIRNAPSPYKAKRLGSKCKIRSDWDEVKLGFMYQIVKAKFSQNEDLKKKLLATMPKYLEETNYWKDRYWGVCDGKGENNLGLILMQVRLELLLEN